MNRFLDIFLGIAAAILLTVLCIWAVVGTVYGLIEVLT